MARSGESLRTTLAMFKHGERCGSYQFLYTISGVAFRDAGNKLPLTLSDRAKSCLCSSNIVLVFPLESESMVSERGVPSRPNAWLQLEVC
jgi:hypothetical protein